MLVDVRAGQNGDAAAGVRAAFAAARGRPVVALGLDGDAARRGLPRREQGAVRRDDSHPAMHVDLGACIHCGLCVRYCAEVKQKHAIGFVDRGIRKEISFR